MKRLIVLLVACMASSMLFANHWTSENPGNYSLVMALNGNIQINGVEQASDQLEVGAFCNGECRGSQMASVFPFTGRYIIMLSIDGENGDQITFKLYDHGLGQELDLTSPSAVTFDQNGLGTYFEPYVLNFTGSSSQIFNLDITGYGSAISGNYQLIASPIGDVNPTAVTNMLSNNYDLYYFDQTQNLEWINYKAGAFNLMPGKGYLYANSENVTLTFTGTPYSGDGMVTLVRSVGADFEGWNLVGNPFGTSATVSVDFYRMNSTGTAIIASDNNSVIVMEGIFVEAATDGATLTFTPSAKGVSAYETQLVLNVSQENSEAVMDRVIVRFGDGNAMRKLRLIDGSAEIYIPKNGTDYAIATSDGIAEVPINFKVTQNGTYTLNADFQGRETNNIRLIDNKTGASIDLLDTPSYTFVGNSSDFVSRFKLVFNINGIEEDSSIGTGIFAFINGKEIVINGAEVSAALQVIDVMGRVIVSVGGHTRCVPTTGIPAGVYVLRLINGDNVMTQKIVIE